MVMNLAFACVLFDNILLLSTTKEAEEHVVGDLASVVPVKTTGEIGDEGGSNFRWSCDQRRTHQKSLWVSILIILIPRFRIMASQMGHHMFLTFQDILKGHSVTRTFRNHCLMWRTPFRKALGKLLWLSQVRHDLKTWMSVLRTGTNAWNRTSVENSLAIFVH